MIDAWLLRNFPGRTLDELDQMDWPRYLRATEAAEIERIETLRQRQIEGKVKANALTADEWKTIQAHDAEMESWGTDGQD